MDAVQFIVERLKGPPFDLRLTLVTFDEKSPPELLQLLNDVLAQLDSNHRRDVRDEPQDAASQRIFHFLQVLKYNVPHSSIESFGEALYAGDRNTVYPILYYLLANFEKLQKRAYVAKYLQNIEVPPEFLHDEEIQLVLQQYRELQAQFKEVHKAADKVRGTSLAPGELKREITQLEEERKQLIEKIDTFKDKTANLDGFKPLLQVTSELRREQEEETKLQERQAEQRHTLGLAERRRAEVARRLTEMRAQQHENVQPQQVLEGLRKEVHDIRSIMGQRLPETLEQRRETLQRLQQSLMEPPKTEEDVYQLRSETEDLQNQIDELTARIAEAQRANGDDKLAMFRQQASIITKRLEQKEQDIESAKQDARDLDLQIENLEAKMSELSGPKFMRRSEFKAYADQLRAKTQKFKRLKNELNQLRQETVVLARTEQILKSRDTDLNDFLEKLEASKGISGYMTKQKQLEQVSELKAQLDETKGKTLHEISRIVTNINSMLKERKNKLAPQIKELRAVRLEYQEFESTYLMAKSQFENTAVGIESERAQLENECDSMQEECIREESQYHYFHNLITIADEQLRRVQEEQRYERGEGRLMRDFATWKDLYKNKAQQQEQLSKQLRRQQKDIKENSEGNMRQKQQFSDLQKLLESKLKQYKEEDANKEQGGGLGFAGYDMELGAANVISFE